jgi:RNA polymerase sigma-B factor
MGGSATPAQTGRVHSDRERLHRRYARFRRPDDLERLVLSYRPFARSLARRYMASADAREDLEQVACEGLIKAIQRFDPARGNEFTAFALPTVLGGVRRYLRDTAWPAHVPRSLQERARAARVQAAACTAATGRAAGVNDLVRVLGWTHEEVVDALEAASSLRVVSLDGGADEPGAVATRLGVEDAGYERIECLAAIEQALPLLSESQRSVLRLRFEEDFDRKEIAGRLGVSVPEAGRALRAALAHLRSAAAPAVTA